MIKKKSCEGKRAVCFSCPLSLSLISKAYSYLLKVLRRFASERKKEVCEAFSVPSFTYHRKELLSFLLYTFKIKDFNKFLFLAAQMTAHRCTWVLRSKTTGMLLKSSCYLFLLKDTTSKRRATKRLLKSSI